MSLQWRIRTKSREERGRLERIKKDQKQTSRGGVKIFTISFPLAPSPSHLAHLEVSPNALLPFSPLSPSVLSPLEIMNVACDTQLAKYLIQFQKPWITPVCVLCTLSLLACMTLEVLNKNISVDRSLVSTAHECVKTIASLQGQNNTPQPNA